MILRNAAHPNGVDVGPVHRFSFLDVPSTGTDDGRPWTGASHHRFFVRKEKLALTAPPVYDRACSSCGTEFRTYYPNQRWCSAACRNRGRVRPSRAKPRPPVVQLCGHEKPPVAFGLCHACYMREWRRRVA